MTPMIGMTASIALAPAADALNGARADLRARGTANSHVRRHYQAERRERDEFLAQVPARLVANTASTEDRNQVQAALSAGVLSIATGERAAAVGGDANGAVIMTGDVNAVPRIDSLGAAIDRLIQRSHPSHCISFLRTSRTLPAAVLSTGSQI
jgi:hypothetical protein